MGTKNFSRRVLPALLGLVFSGAAWASAFQLLEQNASNLGNAYAGSAALAEDASTVFFNPAGMSRLPVGKQVSITLDMVRPSARFSNGASTLPAGITNAGGDGGDAGGWSAVPSGYFVMPLNAQWTAGIGIGAPFGLKTEYDDGWRGRFHATKSDVKTLNLNPSLSYRMNEQVALGFGLNYQKLDAELGSVANLSALLCAPTSPFAALCPSGQLLNLEAPAKVKGDDAAWGYNLGALFQVSERTRIGVAYRSSIKFHVTGDASFNRPTVAAGGVISAGTAAVINGAVAASLADGSVKLDIELPDTFTVSGMHQLDDRWTLLGDVAWTGWSKIKSLDIYRTSGALLSSTPENWRDTLRISLGANYQLNPTTKLRLGLAYDQSPVGNDDYRTPRLPDNDRTWLSVGAQFRLDEASTLDIGYSHLFLPQSNIRDNGHSATNQAAQGFLLGTYKDSVDILGIQYSLRF